MFGVSTVSTLLSNQVNGVSGRFSCYFPDGSVFDFAREPHIAMEKRIELEMRGRPAAQVSDLGVTSTRPGHFSI